VAIVIAILGHRVALHAAATVAARRAALCLRVAVLARRAQGEIARELAGSALWAAREPLAAFGIVRAGRHAHQRRHVAEAVQTARVAGVAAFDDAPAAARVAHGRRRAHIALVFRRARLGLA
jgi:hypothetical protein